MTTISAHDYTPESAPMPTRKPASKLKTTLATAGIVVAIIAGGFGLWEGHDNKIASAARIEEQNKQTAANQQNSERAFREAIASITSAFREAQDRTEKQVLIVNSSVSELSRLVAHLTGKVEGLADRVDNIERRRNQ